MASRARSRYRDIERNSAAAVKGPSLSQPQAPSRSPGHGQAQRHANWPFPTPHVADAAINVRAVLGVRNPEQSVPRMYHGIRTERRLQYARGGAD